MAKYALFIALGHGHVNPTLAIAQELVARGEEAIYYLPEAFCPAVESTGATFRLYESEIFRSMRSMGQRRRQLMRLFAIRSRSRTQR